MSWKHFWVYCPLVNYKIYGEQIGMGKLLRVAIAVMEWAMFFEIVTPIGTLVSVDEANALWERLEYVRIKIKVPIESHIWMKMEDN